MLQSLTLLLATPIVKTLPNDQAGEILTFAEAINARHQGIHQAHDTTGSVMPWAEFVPSLGGAWAEGFPMLDTIRSIVGEDIQRETL